MKKYFNFAYVSAIALLGASGFTACSSEDELVEAEQPQVQQVADNPTYDPVTGLVKSQFVLNIASQSQTKSGATTVQADGANFRGIDNTLIFSFNSSNKRFITSTLAETEATNRYDLGMVAAAGSLDNDGSNSHRILELAMKTGTDALLFYGKAIKASSADNNEFGKVNYNISGKTPTGFSVSLAQRTTETGRYHSTAQVLAAVLTKIIKASATYTVNHTLYPDWEGAATISTNWKDVNPTAQTPRALSPLEEILYEAFKKLTTIKGTELRGGSSRAIITTVNDLYSVTKKVADATPTSPWEELAKNLAENINTQITNYFTITTDVVTALNSISNVKTAMGSDWNSSWDVVVTDEFKDFPIKNFTLPEGAAQLTYDDVNNTFNEKNPGVSLLDRSNTTDPAVYMFPAELMYYCNSGVRTSNTEKTDAKYPNGVTNWDDDSKWSEYGWETGTGSTSVSSSTRATAMVKNVNYGVALLKSNVGIKTGISTLEDNRAALNTGESNQSFGVSAIDFTWTGVIIGSQPASVDWQFLPTSNTHDKLIYDNRVTGLVGGTAVPNSAGSTSADNYTIVFDNYSTNAGQEIVNVALQFVNNGADFWGRDNLIRRGQTFYLVATLNPSEKSVTWDDTYPIPPLKDEDGTSTKKVRVFIQDYMTYAKFKLNTDALQKAFVTLPDLRSSQLSFGLSVDLTWRTGIEFEENLGGN